MNKVLVVITLLILMIFFCCCGNEKLPANSEPYPNDSEKDISHSTTTSTFSSTIKSETENSITSTRSENKPKVSTTTTATITLTTTKKPEYTPKEWGVTLSQMEKEISDYVESRGASYDDTLTLQNSHWFTGISSYGMTSWNEYKEKIQTRIDEYISGELMGVGYSRFKVIFEYRYEEYYTVIDTQIITV